MQYLCDDVIIHILNSLPLLRVVRAREVCTRFRGASNAILRSATHFPRVRRSDGVVTFICDFMHRLVGYPVFDRGEILSAQAHARLRIRFPRHDSIRVNCVSDIDFALSTILTSVCHLNLDLHAAPALEFARFPHLMTFCMSLTCEDDIVDALTSSGYGTAMSLVRVAISMPSKFPLRVVTQLMQLSKTLRLRDFVFVNAGSRVVGSCGAADVIPMDFITTCAVERVMLSNVMRLCGPRCFAVRHLLTYIAQAPYVPCHRLFMDLGSSAMDDAVDAVCRARCPDSYNRPASPPPNQCHS